MKGYQCDACDLFVRRALSVSLGGTSLDAAELHFCSWRCLAYRAFDSRGVPLEVDNWDFPVEALLEDLSEPYEEDGEILVPALHPHRYVLSDEDPTICAECGEEDGNFLHRDDLIPAGEEGVSA